VAGGRYSLRGEATDPGRRVLLGGALALAGGQLTSVSNALAFGEEGAFHARILSMNPQVIPEEVSAARRWAWELTRRTSAPGRLSAQTIRPSSAALLREPFCVWSGKTDPGTLDNRAIRKLRQYLRMGGMMVVDDRDPHSGKFGAGVRRELARVVPDAGIVRLPKEHVLFKTYYILDAPAGRLQGPAQIEAIVRGKTAQVIFLSHDLMGALARKGESWAHAMESGGGEAREQAIRFSINIAMYVLCSDYKDDQVHAPFLMRRRHKKR